MGITPIPYAPVRKVHSRRLVDEIIGALYRENLRWGSLPDKLIFLGRGKANQCKKNKEITSFGIQLD